MAQPRDPESVHWEERAAILSRLVIRARHADADAEQWIQGWEQHASDVGFLRTSSSYWNAALRWIADQRAQSVPQAEEGL